MEQEPSDVAAEIAARLAELHEQARRAKLSTLAYLIDMAQLEADARSRQGDGQS